MKVLSVSITLKVYTNGSFGQIVGVMGKVFSRIEDAGAGTVTWEELNTWDDPDGGYPTRAVKYGASGYFEKVTQASLSGGASLGWTLYATVGENYYYRTSTMTFNGSYSMD